MSCFFGICLLFCRLLGVQQELAWQVSNKFQWRQNDVFWGWVEVDTSKTSVKCGYQVCQTPIFEALHELYLLLVLSKGSFHLRNVGAQLLLRAEAEDAVAETAWGWQAADNPPACRRVLWILLCFGLASALALKESPLTRFSTDSPPPPLPSPPLPLVRPLRPLCPTLHPLHPLLRPLPFPPFLLLLHFLLFQFSAPCIGEP